MHYRLCKSPFVLTIPNSSRPPAWLIKLGQICWQLSPSHNRAHSKIVPLRKWLEASLCYLNLIPTMLETELKYFEGSIIKMLKAMHKLEWGSPNHTPCYRFSNKTMLVECSRKARMNAWKLKCFNGTWEKKTSNWDLTLTLKVESCFRFACEIWVIVWKLNA